eukprot:1640917-Amphidinium_carterae.1
MEVLSAEVVRLNTLHNRPLRDVVLPIAWPAMGRFRLVIAELVEITDVVTNEVIKLEKQRFDGNANTLYIEKNWSKESAVVAGPDTVQRFSVM